jgi:mannose-6-phosphate isomerase-like protein (cupin superfamily)
MTTEPSATLADNYCYFFDDEAFRETDRPGFRRRVITGDHLQLCFWRITGGTGGSVIHQHPANEQLGIVVRGALDFRIGEREGDDRRVLREGEVYLAPFGVWHGDSNFIGDDELNEVWILDVFAPPREDLRNG